ncbi:MAG: outer membrane lipoprotein [Acidobacteriaceae bacterium]
MKTNPSVSLALVAALALSGCATGGYNAGSYNSGLTQQSVELGRVIAVRSVTAHSASGAGGLIGGIGGAALGSQVGHGAGTVIAEIFGGIVGLVAGHQIENHLYTHPALQITIREDNGNLIAVVESGKQKFSKGERVQVIYAQSGKVRVSPL